MYKKITVEELDKLMASVPTNGTAWQKVGTYTLCGKLAINIDDLQCDYDIDWAMPEVGGVVWDTDTAVTIEALEFWNNQAKELLES